MARDTTRITPGAAAAIAVFAMSGMVGPFGATALAKQLPDRGAAPARTDKERPNSSGAGH